MTISKEKTIMTAKEIIDHFFCDLCELEGMDSKTAQIIHELWKKNKLGRDELLTELENARTSEVKNGSEKD